MELIERVAEAASEALAFQKLIVVFGFNDLFYHIFSLWTNTQYDIKKTSRIK